MPEQMLSERIRSRTKNDPPGILLGETLTEWADEVALLEQRIEMTEQALYNAINEGVAHAFLNLDDDSRRAKVLTQEEVTKEALAQQEEDDLSKLPTQQKPNEEDMEGA